MNGETYRKVLSKTKIPATEMARRSRIDRTRLWLFAASTVELSDRQLKALEAALVAAISERMRDFKAGIELLNDDIKVVEAVGARADGQETERYDHHVEQR